MGERKIKGERERERERERGYQKVWDAKERVRGKSI